MRLATVSAISFQGWKSCALTCGILPLRLTKLLTAFLNNEVCAWLAVPAHSPLANFVATSESVCISIFHLAAWLTPKREAQIAATDSMDELCWLSIWCFRSTSHHAL